MQNSKDHYVFPKVTCSTNVFHESIVDIRCDTLQVNNSPPYPYYVLKTFPFAVVILTSTTNDKFLLINEYRHPTGKFILSCPAGYVEYEEDPLEAARRELLEETGYQAESFKILGSAYPYAGMCGQKNIYVRAYNASFLHSPQLEKSEIIYPVEFSKTELFQQLESGTESDANLLAALSFNQLELTIK